MSTNHYGHLMLVEDDDRLARLTAEFLDRQGYRVDIVEDGHQAVRRIPEEQPDLVILDIMLPGQDGLAVCRQVRSTYSGPILLLTAHDQVIYEVLGLEIGADDYLTKPVAPERLVARIRTHLRRAKQFSEQTGTPAQTALPIDRKRPPQRDTSDVLTLETADREAWCGQRRLDLTRPEYDLLALLMAQPGRVLSRDEISEALRGVPYDGYSRHIDVLISGLRQAIDTPEVIKTIRNRGYMLVQHWPGEGEPD